jgi:hypothetical protein
MKTPRYTDHWARVQHRYAGPLHTDIRRTFRRAAKSTLPGGSPNDAGLFTTTRQK